MKLLTLTLILSLFFNSVSRAETQEISLERELGMEVYSPAQFEEPVKKEKLHILGSGLQRGRSDQWLALACYTDNCDTIRFVLMNEGAAMYIGNALKMPTAPSERLKEKAIRAVVDQFFATHQTRISENKYERRTALSFLLIIGLGTLVALSGPLTGAATALVAAETGGTMLGIYSTGYFPSLYDHLQNGGIIEVDLTSKDGWNWNTHAKKISRKNFDMLLGQILYGKVKKFKEPNSQPYSKCRKIARQKNRLRKKGVDFGGDAWAEDRDLERY